MNKFFEFVSCECSHEPCRELTSMCLASNTANNRGTSGIEKNTGVLPCEFKKRKV